MRTSQRLRSSLIAFNLQRASNLVDEICQQLRKFAGGLTAYHLHLSLPLLEWRSLGFARLLAVSTIALRSSHEVAGLRCPGTAPWRPLSTGAIAFCQRTSSACWLTWLLCAALSRPNERSQAVRIARASGHRRRSTVFSTNHFLPSKWQLKSRCFGCSRPRELMRRALHVRSSVRTMRWYQVPEHEADLHREADLPKPRQIRVGRSEGGGPLSIGIMMKAPGAQFRYIAPEHEGSEFE